MKSDLLGAYVIWLRELKRFWRDKSRVLGAIMQPTLYLFILGTGLGSVIMSARTGAIGSGQAGFGGYVTFIYPGIIGMTALFTSIFSAISIIWDREFGFLKEVLVAPVSRWAVALGKALGGSSVATMQGLLLLVFAPLVGVQLTPLMVVKLTVILFATSFALTSMGIVVAATLKTIESFQMVMNFLMMPIFFLSGAMFPLVNLPAWLAVLTKLDPLAYGVDALRGTMLVGQNVPAGSGLLTPQVYSLGFDFAVILGFGAVMIALAVVAFSRQE
ncbi:MAG: ABC transporter [Actinobacteria bacterium]|nr:MAG: ABC transporter [Actinomycetota bacterium]